MTSDGSRTPVLTPGQTIGVLGGGQLGRMLAMAAARLGLRVHVYDPDPRCPAADVAAELTQAPFEDGAAMARFAASVNAITFEWESVPTAALSALHAAPPIRPPVHAVNVLQDRLAEKRFLTELGLRTAPFEEVDSPEQLAPALARIGYPAILKTRRFGYDGRGQVRLDGPHRIDSAVALVATQPCVLEGFVAFEREVSVVAARCVRGNRACYEPGESAHEDGILRTTRVPAQLGDEQARAARRAAELVLDALDYVGVLGVEFFVTESGLVVNEVAPRVHNSGHWTEAGCHVDQFEQHIRAVAGWPLGDPRRHSDVTMKNLIGDDVHGWPEYLTSPHAALHVYGKRDVRPGRKMGHVNFIGERSTASPRPES